MTPPSATQGNSDIQIPKKYDEYADVFDKVKASVLPKHRSYDCPIDLPPGQEPMWGPIYNFSEHISRRILLKDLFDIQSLHLVLLCFL